MLVRHGQVVAEGWWGPYAADERHMLFSLSKSFTSTAVGLAVADGKLNVDDPQDIRDFPYTSEESVVKKFLERPVSHKPGTFFFYNTPASYMLSAIVQKVTGQPVLDYLGPRLFEPLGIVNPAWDASKPRHVRCLTAKGRTRLEIEPGTALQPSSEPLPGLRLHVEVELVRRVVQPATGAAGRTRFGITARDLVERHLDPFECEQAIL